MFVVLQIGYQRFLLESDHGLQTVLKALSRGYIIESDDRHNGGRITTKGMAEIRCEVLPPTYGWSKQTKDVLVPEVVKPERLKQPDLPALLAGEMRRRLRAMERKQLMPPKEKQ